MKRGSVTYRWLDRHVGIPFLLCTSVLARRRKLPQDIRRIGVIASTTLGDTVLNSAALLDLRRHYPDAHISFFYAPTNFGAAELLPGVDELVPIKLTDARMTIRAFRNARLDLLLDFTSWQRLTAFYAAVSGARYRVGFETPGQHRHGFYDQVVPHSRHRHEVDNFRTLLGALGIQGQSEPKLQAPWLEEARQGSEARSQDQNEDRSKDGIEDGSDDRSEIIVFHPWATGDRHALREWSEQNWVSLAAAIQGPRTRFLITGGPDQTARSQELCRALASKGLDAAPFVGSRGLRSLAVMLQGAALVVSVNTGVMHLAAVLGAPTIALNGPNASHRWGPRGPRSISVDPHGGGGGFLHLGFEFDGNPTDCMERTRVEDVVAAAARLLPRLAASRPDHEAGAPLVAAAGGARSAEA